jgi:cell wall-associated NlpC family hydrolase
LVDRHQNMQFGGVMSKQAVRQRVVDIALGQLGAHYLWGSQGSTPNMAGKEVKFNPKSLNPNTVSFCAARCDRVGPQVCGGRYARRTLPAGLTNPTSPGSPALKKWLDENGHFAETNWDDSLTPRLTMGTGVTKQIVWGEGCDDTRHFDCISFINWCLGHVRSVRPTYDMYHYFYSIEPRGAITATDVTDEDPSKAQPADLLFYGDIVKSHDYFIDRIQKERDAHHDEDADADQKALDRGTTSEKFIKDYHIPVVPTQGVGAIHHIGFATGKGDGRVHASDNSQGVITDTWHSPVRRIRLPDSFFE